MVFGMIEGEKLMKKTFLLTIASPFNKKLDQLDHLKKLVGSTDPELDERMSDLLEDQIRNKKRQKNRSHARKQKHRGDSFKEPLDLNIKTQ